MRIALLASAHPRWTLRLATEVAAAGDTVTVVLLDGAAALARPAHPEAELVQTALSVGVVVLAHDDALRRRGMSRGALQEGVKAVETDELADLITDAADKVAWL